MNFERFFSRNSLTPVNQNWFIRKNKPVFDWFVMKNLV